MGKAHQREQAQGDRAVTRRYLLELAPGIVGFLALFLAITTWGDLESGKPWNFILAVSPIVPILWMIVAVVRHVRRIDEFQQILILQSFALGFGVAMLTALAIALIGMTGIVVIGTEWYVFILGMTAWLTGSIWANRR
ncbi:hypothetical protein [Microbacterium sp. MPKO10]|uniref:hypothetical protein n=1 Tax=Microbacterium sp. MPKO10 TaxID=2989818 RepID=UPI0022356779|nr:hypothetical protein [Microbacterium sp. MPKO10]MCW4458810.1 hypothetical protein [Microbacterium sp. MPKO10]